MKQVANISEYQAIVEKYGQKGVRSNDYIQQEAVDLIMRDAFYVDCYGKNAFFFVKKEIGMRMYYYINDLTENADFCNIHDVVVEILFRGEIPNAEIEYLTKQGFHFNLIRDQYAAMYGELAGNIAFIPGVIVEEAKSYKAVETACELFNGSFDKLSGDFIPASEYQNLLDTGSILIAWNADKTSFLGALHQVKEGAVNVIGHVAVMEHARGKGVGKALVDAFVERNKDPEKKEKTRYQLWVQRQNEAAVKMYQNKGFKYINKSTISLIKYKRKMEKLLELLAGIRPDVDFENETALIDDGILDSFDVVSIISALDDEFDVQVRISELDPDNFNSVQAIWDLVQSLKK